MHAYDQYTSDIATRHLEYEALLSDKTTKIRQTEAENLRLGKKKVLFYSRTRNSSSRELMVVLVGEHCRLVI